MHYRNFNSDSVKTLLGNYGIQVNCVKSDAEIPYSFWGCPEAGRLHEQLYIRGDTPIHSILHEACHYICMPADHRARTLVDAMGSAMEENAACYLQILLSDHIKDYSRDRLMQDMDAWGYSFRLGSAQAWFTRDADDVEHWLIEHEIINIDNNPTWKLRK